MPVYKFYCPDCHTIFNFFSRRVDTETRPACPGCSRPDLERQASPFAISKARGEHTEDAELPPGMDEAELGDVLEQEDPFFTGTAARSPLPDLKTLRRELMPPRRDETWYPLR